MNANEIQECITAFLDSQNTEHTRRSYGTALAHFVRFLAESGVREQDHVDTLAVDHAIEFVPWLRREISPAKSTLQLYLTAVYRFYRHLLKSGVRIEASDLARLEENFRDARNIRGETRPKDYNLEAVEAVISAARASTAERRELVRLRDVALVETLRATGCRVGELVGMQHRDLDPETQSALVKGKGSKWRSVYWDEVAWGALMEYMARKSHGEGSVFCGHGNRSNHAALTTRHVSRIIQALAERAGVEGVTPHYFRHVFATRALDRTNNLALVQDLLGHASPVTTRTYARTDEGQRQAAHARVWE